MKKITVLLVSCMLGGSILFTGCSDSNRNESREGQETTDVKKEENTTKITPSQKNVSSSEGVEAVKQQKKITTSSTAITDSETVDSVIMYKNGDDIYLTTLDDGKINIDLRYFPDKSITVLGRYVLNGDDKNVSVTDLNLTTSEFEGLTSYYIKATLKSEETSPFLVAYKVCSDGGNYSIGRIAVIDNGEFKVVDSIMDREKSNESYSVEIIGTSDFLDFDNNNIFYNNTEYAIDYSVRGQFEQKQSYRQFTGTTNFSLNDNTMLATLRMQENCTSELGNSSRYTYVPVYQGKGVKSTFLEIPGDQAEDPKYQFIADGIIQFQPVNSDGTYE